MSRGADDATVASPCTSVCVIDSVTGLCGGCFRMLEEIAGWIDFSATEKRRVIAALDARRSNFGAAIEARLEDRAERAEMTRVASLPVGAERDASKRK